MHEIQKSITNLSTIAIDVLVIGINRHRSVIIHVRLILLVVLQVQRGQLDTRVRLETRRGVRTLQNVIEVGARLRVLTLEHVERAAQVSRLELVRLRVASLVGDLLSACLHAAGVIARVERLYRVSHVAIQKWKLTQCYIRFMKPLIN
jgi:hypothetical protein